MSVNLKSGGTNYCITVCYRVGTLGEQNFNEIERHLANVFCRKKFQAHIVVGDFNFPDIDWSKSIASSTTELGCALFFRFLGHYPERLGDGQQITGLSFFLTYANVFPWVMPLIVSPFLYSAQLQ